MKNIITEILGDISIFLSLILPLLCWVWLFICKYIIHFHKKCNSRHCWYQCSKCQYSDSQNYNLRIAVLEQAQKQKPTQRGKEYIEILKKERQKFLNNPEQNRETKGEVMTCIIEQAMKEGD